MRICLSLSTLISTLLSLAALVFFLEANASFAAFKSAKDPVSALASNNPQPLDDDIVLPMPCSQTMTLRAVDVPASSLIQDRSFSMGIANAPDADRQLYESRFQGHIAAPFTTRNLPEKWRATIAKNNKGTNTWYFIGKYEVSRLQWESVMLALNDAGIENASQCPSPAMEGAQLPVSGISWFDAQEFLRRYNAWLVKTHAADLPAFDGSLNTPFLRLPTEEEWEYAARGGTRVPPEWWAENDFYPLEKDKSLKDYAVFNSGTPLQGPLPIGARNANPLGIHDMAGNVREMADGFFRLSVPDMRNGQVERRLHGAAGGILSKGGSFRAGGEAILPGARDEVALYTANGPGKANDLGLRLVLASLNIPDAQRLDTLREEEKNSGSQGSAQAAIDNSNNPMEALEAVTRTTEGPLRSRLLKIRTMFEDTEKARANLDNQKLEHSFRSLLYQAETLRAFAYRYVEVGADRENIRRMLEKPMDSAARERATKLAAILDKDLEDYLLSLQMGANYYKTSLDSIISEPANELARLEDQARKEYGGSGIFNQHMLQNLDILEKFIKIARRSGISSISRKTLLKDIIPAKHFNALPLDRL